MVPAKDTEKKFKEYKTRNYLVAVDWDKTGLYIGLLFGLLTLALHFKQEARR